MRYRLIVLTHGDSATLSPTIESFRRAVSPAPVERWLIVDRPVAETATEENPEWVDPYFDPDHTVFLGGRGFCEATWEAWNVWAAGADQIGSAIIERAVDLEDVDFVFWLEHDFTFLRLVDLEALAEELDYDPTLAQMALIRGPANERERALGGLVASWQFPHVLTWTHTRAEAHPYLLHHGYFTTNPSLMRLDFMRENPWPNAPAECEGKFGIELRERGYRFGAWGDGDQWVEHIGERTGHGY